MSKFPKEYGSGSGSRFFKQFSSDTAGYSESRFELNVQKNASTKIIFQVFAFLIMGRTIVRVSMKVIEKTNSKYV